MLYEFVKKNKVPLILLLLIVVVGFTAYGIYLSIQRSDKIEVTITPTPRDAKVTLNGTETPTGTVYLKKGQYVVEAKKEGFATYSETLYVDTDQNTFIGMNMTPESEEAQKWAEENQELYSEVEGDAGQEAQEYGQSFRQKNPIVELLPEQNLLYTIGYRLDPADVSNSSIIIEIDAEDGYRENAITQLQEWGYDPTDLKINFNNYVNPF